MLEKTERTINQELIIERHGQHWAHDT